MLKSRFFCLRHIATTFLLCLILFTACQNSSYNNDPSNKPDNPSDNPPGSTWIEFINLEEFPVTIYSDSARQVVFAEIPASGTKIVSAEPAPMGKAFYPTYLLIYSLETSGNINIPYNGPSITAAVLADKTNTVSIPKLETIVTNSAYIMLVNNSGFSLTFNEGSFEKSPLGGGPSIINSNQNASYEITPKSVSSYSVLRNGSTPVAFPVDLSEFKAGIIYVFIYNGTALTLTSQNSILQKIPPSTPTNVRIEGTSNNSVQITWDAVYGATSYQVYRASWYGSTRTSYGQVANITTLSWTDTNISADYTYYYSVSAVSGVNMVSEQSAEVAVIMPLRVTTITTTSVTLGWNAISLVRGYNIYRSNGENETYTKINSAAISGTAFTDTDVTAYTTYYYKVSTILGDIESGMSSFVSATTGVIVPGSGLISKFAWLQSNAANNNLYFIEITTDENIAPQSLSYNGKSGITIILSGSGTMRTVNLSAQGSLFTVGSGVTLILDNNIILNGRSGNNTSLVYINSGGLLVMNAETKIIGNSNSSSSGAGVYVSGTFTMNGGEISGNNDYFSNGGGVYVNGTFIMNSGKISCNTTYDSYSSRGGGVYVNGTFTMNGGEISGNTSSSYDSYSRGGGVYVGGTFIMNGGKISGNIASGGSYSYGGGVYVYGTFNMKDGEISGNTATRGGGVYTESTFCMGGGIIYGSNTVADLKNTADSGTALYKYSGSAQYGTFTGNTFYKSGDLSSTTNTTIRIVNGNLLTE